MHPPFRVDDGNCVLASCDWFVVKIVKLLEAYVTSTLTTHIPTTVDITAYQKIQHHRTMTITKTILLGYYLFWTIIKFQIKIVVASTNVLKKIKKSLTMI